MRSGRRRMVAFPEGIKRMKRLPARRAAADLGADSAYFTNVRVALSDKVMRISNGCGLFAASPGLPAPRPRAGE